MQPSRSLCGLCCGAGGKVPKGALVGPAGCWRGLGWRSHRCGRNGERGLERWALGRSRGGLKESTWLLCVGQGLTAAGWASPGACVADAGEGDG